MRILLDESAPRRLKQLLEDHDVWTVQQKGWNSKENGELLSLAGKECDVFLTPDRNLPHQQKRPNIDLAVIVLAAGPNRMHTGEGIADKIRSTVDTAQPGK